MGKKREKPFKKREDSKNNAADRIGEKNTLKNQVIVRVVPRRGRNLKKWVEVFSGKKKTEEDRRLKAPFWRGEERRLKRGRPGKGEEMTLNERPGKGHKESHGPRVFERDQKEGGGHKDSDLRGEKGRHVRASKKGGKRKSQGKRGGPHGRT